MTVIFVILVLFIIWEVIGVTLMFFAAMCDPNKPPRKPVNPYHYYDPWKKYSK